MGVLPSRLVTDCGQRYYNVSRVGRLFRGEAKSVVRETLTTTTSASSRSVWFSQGSHRPHCIGQRPWMPSPCSWPYRAALDFFRYELEGAIQVQATIGLAAIHVRHRKVVIRKFVFARGARIIAAAALTVPSFCLAN